MPFVSQHIEPTPPDDPQPNPIDTPDDIVTLYDEALSPEKELDLVVKSIGRWLPQHPDRTCAVLVPDNQRGFKVSEALEAAQLPHDDMLRSTVTTREAARALGHISALSGRAVVGLAAGTCLQGMGRAL